MARSGHLRPDQAVWGPGFFGPRGSRALVGFRPFLARQFIEGETLADDLANHVAETLCVIHRLAVIEAESLFVNVAEQVERLDDHVGTADSAL
jgi:hypothetical protein